MARTEQGAALTENHRRAQLQLRARALGDYMRLWPIWRLDDPNTFGLLVTATLPLVRAYYRVSSSLAASYYDAFRKAEDASGNATPRIAASIADAQITTSLYATGQVVTQKALRAGQTVQQARETALVRTSGAVTRHVLQGGRDTLIRSTSADSKALGLARVTDTAPCAFCAFVAGRGPVETTRFHAHDHCGCTAEPSYADSEWPGRAREFQTLYNQTVADATAAGGHDGGTSEPLSAFRRVYDTGR